MSFLYGPICLNDKQAFCVSQTSESYEENFISSHEAKTVDKNNNKIWK